MLFKQAEPLLDAYGHAICLSYADTPEFAAAIARHSDAFKKPAPKLDLKQ